MPEPILWKSQRGAKHLKLIHWLNLVPRHIYRHGMEDRIAHNPTSISIWFTIILNRYYLTFFYLEWLNLTGICPNNTKKQLSLPFIITWKAKWRPVQENKQIRDNAERIILWHSVVNYMWQSVLFCMGYSMDYKFSCEKSW